MAGRNGAGDETRTRDTELGSSYSTNWATPAHRLALTGWGACAKALVVLVRREEPVANPAVRDKHLVLFARIEQGQENLGTSHQKSARFETRLQGELARRGQPRRVYPTIAARPLYSPTLWCTRALSQSSSPSVIAASVVTVPATPMTVVQRISKGSPATSARKQSRRACRWPFVIASYPRNASECAEQSPPRARCARPAQPSHQLRLRLNRHQGRTQQLFQ